MPSLASLHPDHDLSGEDCTGPGLAERSLLMRWDAEQSLLMECRDQGSHQSLYVQHGRG